WLTADSIERSNINNRKEYFTSEIACSEIMELELLVITKEMKVLAGGFVLPALEIHALNELKKEKESLVRLLEKNNSLSRASVLKAECKGIEYKISELEFKRDEIIIEYYPGGNFK